jgi:hypothetical protein
MKSTPQTRQAKFHKENPMHENMFVMPLTAQTEKGLNTAVARWTANMLFLPCLCRKFVCRRTRMCSADPVNCIDRLGPLVPEDAQDGVETLLEGKMEGFTYDEVRAEAPFEIDAYEMWVAKVQRAAAPPDRKRKIGPPPSQLREFTS